MPDLSLERALLSTPAKRTQLPSSASAAILPPCHAGGGLSAERRSSRPKGSGVRTLRLALPFLTMTGLLAASANPAIAGTALSCDASSVVARTLPAIVNVTVVRVGDSEEEATNGEGESAKEPADGHIAVFVGTGSVIDPSGIIVTNKHVIQGAALIKVTFSDKSTASAELIAAGSLVDLALLKVDVPRPLPTLQFGNSDDLKLGQPVIAIGNPLGLGTSVSTGVISALNRDLMRSPFDDYIQTDASINPGNSGGPLLDCAGEMVGVDTALMSNNKTLGSIGLGFALPSNVAKFVASQLSHLETATPGWIGLHLQDLTSDLARTFGHPNMVGAIVTRVDPNSPAAQANLQSGDIIMGIDGRALPDNRAILRKITTTPIGKTIALSVWRQNHSEEATLQVKSWPHMMALRSQVLASPKDVALAQALGCGLHLAVLTDANRQRYHLTGEPGVLIDQVFAGSEAQTMGFQAGDVIEKIGDMAVTKPDEVMARVSHGSAANGDVVALLVRGTSGTRWLTLYVGRVDVAQLVAAPDFLDEAGSARNAAAEPR
jgi:serine protease Do